MAIINLHPFGKINTNELDEYYESEIQISNKMVSVDLNFFDYSIDDSVIKKVQMFIEKISDFEKSAFDYLLKDFNKGDNSEAVKLYMEHHLEELEQDELERIFGTTAIDIKLFLSKLVLQRIGFYPEDDNAFALLDITMPDNVTNYLISVYFDQNGRITNISMES